MLRFLFLLSACLLLPASLVAQTPEAHLTWDFSAPVATVNTYAQQATVDGVVLSGAITCVGTSATSATCRIVVPRQGGPRDYAVTSTVNNVTTTTRATIDQSAGPALPSGLRINVSVTVQVGQ